MSSDKVSVLTMVNARGDAMAVAACRGKMGVADARRAMAGCALEGAVVSVNIIFTISTNAFSPIAPTRIHRIRQRGCAAFGA